METKTYVLVHGAWHGGWVWARLAQRLRARGHVVFSPTMTGCGERSHLLNRDNDLELNIRDVLAAVQYEELNDIILCGHSYGGMVVRAVADRIPSAVRTLVYVEGYVPGDGECVLDLRSAGDNEILMEQVELNGDGWRMPPRSAEDLRVQRASDRAWVNSHLSDTALRCFTQPVTLRRKSPEHIGNVYVRAGDYPNERFEAHYQDALASSRWSSHLVEQAGHDIMVDQPEALAEILLDGL